MCMFDRTFKTENSTKKKRLINLCEHLVSPRKISNENIPVKLLNELATLSNHKFKIEIKSKYQSLTLPLGKHSQKVQIKSNSPDQKENGDAMDQCDDEIKNQVLTESNQQSDSNSSSSALQNDYVILKCDIVNRSLTLVPAVRIFVPYNYPDANPFVDCVQFEEFEDDMLPEYSKKFNIYRIFWFISLKY